MPGMFVNHADNEVTVTMTVDQSNAFAEILKDVMEQEDFLHAWQDWVIDSVVALDEVFNGDD